MQDFFIRKEGKITNQFDDSEILEMDIVDYLDCLIDYKGDKELNYRSLLEYYGHDIPYSVIQKYKLNPRKDYVFENLQTHDADILIRKVKEFFPDFEIVEFKKINDEKRFVILNFSNYGTFEDLLDALYSKRFESLTKFFNYSIRNVSEYKCFSRVEFEPIYSYKTNVQNKIYHITTREKAEIILKRGFKIFSGGSNRYYPERTYFLKFPFTLSRGLKMDGFRLAYHMFVEENHFNDETEMSIIEVDVSRLNVNFYEDSVSKIDDDIFKSIFTYTPIPEKFCRIYWNGTVKQLMTKI